MNAPDSATPTITPVEPLALPPVLGEVVSSLETNLSLPPAVGIAVALQTVSAAVGAAAVLRDDPAPPLSPSLHTFVAASAGSILPRALDAVLAPLRVIQGEFLALAASGPPQLARAGNPPATFEERARLLPVILAEDLTFADFMAAPARAFDGHVFHCQGAAAWGRLWTELAATPNGSRQRLFLQCLAGSGPASQGGVSLLAELRPGSLAWAGLVDFLPADVCQRSLILDAGLAPACSAEDAALPAAVAEAWEERLRELFQLRGLDTPLAVTVSAPARAAFRRFHAELVKETVSLPAASLELVFGWPALARRLALLLHLVGTDAGPLDEATAVTAIALARFYGEHLLSLRDAARLQLEAQALQADCDRLLRALQQLGTATRRQIFRNFHGQSYERWNKALMVLLEDGRVIEPSVCQFTLPESQLPAYTATL